MKRIYETTKVRFGASFDTNKSAEYVSVLIQYLTFQKYCTKNKLFMGGSW